MKYILCPTDFSDVSLNAINYGDALAKVFDAELILYHLYHITPVEPGSGAYLSSDLVEAAEEEAKTEMEKIMKKLSANNSNGKYSYEVKYGLATDEIIGFIKKKGIDLVVMGTKGAEGLRKLFFGSISGSVIGDAKCPVLVIPEHAKYEPVEEIVYSTDLHGNEASVVEFIGSFAKKLNAHVSVLSIEKDDSKNVKDIETYAANNILNKTSYKNIDFTVNEGKDVQESIVKFCKLKGANILVMATYERNFIEKIFTKSLTKELAYHPEIPILSMHKSKS